MTNYTAAVVGSGPNGLSAAVALAQAGHTVVVYEGSDTIGGGARTAELTLPGFRHDVCSAIHPMAVGSPFLQTLPLGEHGLEWIHPPSPLAHPLDGKPAVMLERSVDETESHLGERVPAWLRECVERWDELARASLGPPGFPECPWLMARFGLRALLPASVLARWMFRKPAGRALLAGIAAHSFLPMERTPSAAIGVMLWIAGHAVGWPMPRGGAQSISDALASILRSLGGQIVTGHRIASLDQVNTTGPVVFDTSPREMASIARESLPMRYRRRLQRFRYGPGIFKVDWALSEPIPWADPKVSEAATVHLGGTLEEIAASERAPWHREICERPYVLLAQQSLFDPTRAPPGRHTGWAYCHVPSGSTVDMTDIIEAQVERFAPGFRDCILARHVRNSEDYESYNPNLIGGDPIGGAATLSQIFTRPVARLSPYTTPNPRLFLCSASTPPGGGVHGMCGWSAVQAVLTRHRVPPRARQLVDSNERSRLKMDS